MMEGLHIQPPDLTIVAGYFLAMLGIGVFFARRVGSMREFFGGGGKVPWWLSGISFYMTSFSAFAFVVYSQLAYTHGLAALSVFWMSSFAALISALLFAEKWHRAAKTSALEFIEQRYGNLLRQLLAWTNIPLRIIDNGLKLYAIGTLVAGATGLGPPAVIYSILFSGVIVFLYTFLGGLWAVVVTDFVQAIVMFLGVAALIPLSLQRAGGIGAFVEGAPEGFFEFTNETFSVGYLAAWLVLLVLNYSSSWALVQRYYSVPCEADARKVGYLVAVLQALNPPLLFLPALVWRVISPDLSGTDAEQVYAIICRTLLPVGMIGLLISAMFSATMSTLSGEFNAVASVMTNDVYHRLIAPRASPAQLARMGRLATFLVGALCMAVALMVWMNPEGTSLFDRMVKVFSIFMPPIAIPMLMGLSSRKVSNAGAMGGLLAGIAMGLAAYFLSLYSAPFEVFKKNEWMIPLTIFSSFLGLGLAQLFLPSSKAEQQRIDQFFETSSAMRETTASDRDAIPIERVSPSLVIGCALLFLGALMFAVLLLFEGMKASGISLGIGFSMGILGLLFCWMGKTEKH